MPNVTIAQYPEHVTETALPWMMFEVKTGRHILRQGVPGAETSEKDKTLAACALYLPADALSSSHSVGYETPELGALGYALEVTANKGQLQRPALTASGTSGITDFLEGLKSGGAAAGLAGGQQLVVNALNTKLKDLTGNDLTGINTEATVSAVTGLRLNQRTDILYKDVEYRTHDFTFKLIPRKEEEAKAIDTILNLFHYYSLPSFGNGNGADKSMFIGYPYEFVITMFTQHNGNKHHINTIERSVLTQISVDHAAAGEVSFINPMTKLQEYYPAVTELKMTFRETRLPGRDPRNKNQAGGGNVVMRGTLNESGWPNETQDNIGVKNDPATGAIGEVSGATSTILQTTEGLTNDQKIEIWDNTGHWLSSTIDVLQDQLRKNDQKGTPGLYGNPNPKRLTGNEVPRVGDWRTVSSSPPTPIRPGRE